MVEIFQTKMEIIYNFERVFIFASAALTNGVTKNLELLVGLPVEKQKRKKKNKEMKQQVRSERLSIQFNSSDAGLKNWRNKKVVPVLLTVSEKKKILFERTKTMASTRKHFLAQLVCM